MGHRQMQAFDTDVRNRIVKLVKNIPSRIRFRQNLPPTRGSSMSA